MNVTSSESLNQSLLEWGNSTGFTNVSMTNVSGMTNWYVNMTSLADGTYNYTIFAQNTTGNWNQTQRRFVYIDTTPPYSIYACQGLTIAGGSYILVQNVSSSGTCFNVLANNITLDGAGYTVNYSQSVTGYGVNVTSRNNVTVKNLNVVQGNSSIINAYAVFGSSMTNSTISGNNITTSGTQSTGILLLSNSNDNVLSNNSITTTGTGAVGIFLSNPASRNQLVNNYVKTKNVAIQIEYSSLNNSIIGGSFVSTIGDSVYYLRSVDNSNNFTNTNFTTSRKIQLGDTTSYFNYNNETNGNIWLKTNISAADTLTRTLITWSNSTMKWNDTNSTAGLTANYNLAGLQANAQYKIYNTSAGTQTNSYTLTTDSAGGLNFTIVLNGNTEIIVNTSAGIDNAPVISSLNSPANNSNFTAGNLWLNATGYDDFNLTAMELNVWNSTSLVNQTNITNPANNTMVGIQVTLTNGTYRWNYKAYDNASQNAWYSSNYTFTIDGIPPTSNAPSNAEYTQNSSATIGWILYDNYAGGNYTVYRNGTIQNQSAWQNNTNLNIWVNTSAIGTWNYTITYNDSLGNNGLLNTVIINITGDLSAAKYSLNSTNSTTAGMSVKQSLYWTEDTGLSGYIFSFDNGNGTFYNDSWVSFTGISNWSNVTKTVNSTVGAIIRWRVYANDTSNNWNTSAEYSYLTTNNPPAYSSTGTNNTLANQSTKFYAYWTDDVGLSGFIFSTNNSGIWVNYSSAFSGTGNWSNYTITLNATAGLSIGYRFYANDTGGQWNDTGMLTLTTTQASQINCTKYVATYGNNASDGLTLASAWKNPAYAVQQAVAGDTICLVDGIWYNEHVVFANSGNVTNPITLTAYNGTPTLDGVNNTDISDGLNGIVVSDAGSNFTKNYININGINVTNYYQGILVRESHHINLTNVSVYNNTGTAIFILDSNNVILQNSDIHDNGGWDLGGTGWNTVQIQTQDYIVHNISILNNQIHDSPGTSKQGTSDGHNLVDLNMNSPSKLLLYDINVIGNRIYNSAPSQNGFFEHSASADYIGMERINFSNNVVHNVGSNQFSHNRNSIVQNNTFYDNTYGIQTQANILESTTFISNTEYNNTASPPVYISVKWNSTVYFISNNISSIRILNGTAYISDSVKESFTIQSSDGAKITLNYSDSNIFTENGANTTYYYPDRSEYITTGDETVTITKYNMTARPSSGYATITTDGVNLTSIQTNITDMSSPKIWNITIFSNNSATTATFNISTGLNSQSFRVYRNGTLYTTVTTNSTGGLNYKYSGGGFGTYEFSFQEVQGLAVSLNSPQNSLLTSNATVTFNCSASSGSPLVNITLYGNWSSGWSAKNSTNITGTSNSSQWVNTLTDGPYRWNCLAYDSTGNSSFATSNYTFTIDTIKPVMSFVNMTPNNSATANNWAYINITSSESLSTALLEWNGTAPNLTMQGSGTNRYYNKTGLVNGNYTFKVYANDSANNWNVTETRWAYANYTAGYPQYSNISANTTQKNASALFSAYWTDVVGLSGFVFSTNNSGAWANYTNNFSGTGNWSNYTITLNSTIGLTVGYIFYANNTNNNWNSTGINTLVTGCMESWTYSAWSTCSGGTQTRTASDANSCGTSVNRSALSQSCSSSATSNEGGTSRKSAVSAASKSDIAISVDLNTAVPNPSISATITASVPVSAPSEPVYQYINITKNNFNNSQIENATIEFKVNRSWILVNNFTNISLVRYENGWIKLKTELINSTTAQNIYRAYADGFSYFAIVGEKAQIVQPSQLVVQSENITEQATSKTPDIAPSKLPEQPFAFGFGIAAVLIAGLLLVAGIYEAGRMVKGRKKR